MFDFCGHCCISSSNSLLRVLQIKKKNMADGEDELEAVEVLQALELTGENAPLLSPGNPLSHVNFSISFSRPFLVFIERKARTMPVVSPTCQFANDQFANLSIRLFFLAGKEKEATGKEKPDTRVFIAVFHLLMA